MKSINLSVLEGFLCEPVVWVTKSMEKLTYHKTREDRSAVACFANGEWEQLDSVYESVNSIKGGEVIVADFTFLRDAFWELLPDISQSKLEPVKRSKNSSPIDTYTCVGVDRFIDYVQTFLLVKKIYSGGSHILLQEGNKPCSVYDVFSDSYIGLHLDQLQSWGWSDRQLLNGRLLINLGESKRGLCLIPKPLECLKKDLEIEFPNENHALYSKVPNSQFVETYLNLCKPEVVRIDMDPGVGVFFPAQNMIHDGYTKSMTDTDVVFNSLIYPNGR